MDHIPSPSSNEAIRVAEQFGAHNYYPLPVVIARAKGVWVWDVEGRKYLDMLSAYSALNHGHCHPKIVGALKRQADRLTITSRAFHSDKLSEFYRELSSFTGKPKILPMNTGAEAVETAIKAARRWAYRHKGIPDGEAEIIVCSNNFHGRTITVTSFSSDEAYRQGFGPFTPGFRIIPYGNAEALEQAITPNTAAFLVEPMQGEAGVILPPAGYLRNAADICKRHRVLFIADEIQTGFGRTGRRFACDHEHVVPDVYVLGKALGGGVFPVSAVAADREVLEVFEPGSHGSTFGGNPLACAAAIAALEVTRQERLPERSEQLGTYFLRLLRQLKSPFIREIRGRGLFIGLELNEPARPWCEKLMQAGLLCKETHGHVIRLTPPLTITRPQLKWAFERIRDTLLSSKPGSAANG